MKPGFRYKIKIDSLVIANIVELDSKVNSC